MSQQFKVGVGINSVTDPAIGLPMLGFANPNQSATATDLNWYAIPPTDRGQKNIFGTGENPTPPT